MSEGDVTRHEATRRCVVCRNTDRKHALLRFVVGPGGELLFDVRHKLAGRGLNVSPSRDCLEKAARGAFKRGTKGAAVKLPSDPAAWIESEVVAPLVRHYGELLSLGRRSGQLLVGASVVERAARADGLAAYVLATDASPGTHQKYGRNAERKSVAVLGLLGRATLGRLVGREQAVVAGWVTGELFERFALIERQLRALEWQEAVEDDGAPARDDQLE